MGVETYEKYKNMKKEEAENLLQEEISYLKGKKTEKDLARAGTTNIIGGGGGMAGRVAMLQNQYGKQINPLSGSNPNGFDKQINGLNGQPQTQNPDIDKPPGAFFDNPRNPVEQKYQRGIMNIVEKGDNGGVSYRKLILEGKNEEVQKLIHKGPKINYGIKRYTPNGLVSNDVDKKEDDDPFLKKFQPSISSVKLNKREDGNSFLNKKEDGNSFFEKNRKIILWRQKRKR